MKKRKVAVVLIDRANYGRLKPVMTAISQRPDLELQVMCAGTMVLERFGLAANIVKNDGFPVVAETYIELEGSTPTTMAKSMGFAVIEFSSEFQRLKPDIVLIIGDRYEAFAAAMAAAYMNICVAHVQGGEVSGSIDESTRHCITKLAHYHFPATARSAEYIIRMGERKDTVFPVGCPSGDIVLGIDRTLPPDVFKNGVGGKIDQNKPYMLAILHPITTDFGHEKQNVQPMLDAIAETGHPTVWLWPNIDAGSDHVSKTLRRYRETKNPPWLRFIKNFPPETFLKVLANAACVVGNSSSFVRDSSFLGTPVVLVGDRQSGREVAENLIRTKTDYDSILGALRSQLAHGPYAPSRLYGDGKASQRIADALASVPLYAQKRLDYCA